MPTAPFAPPPPCHQSYLRSRGQRHRCVPAGISSIVLATTSTPPKTIPDLARLCTGRSAPLTLTVAPAPRRAPSSRAASPVITTSSLNDSRPSPQSTSNFTTGIPVGVVRTSGAQATVPVSSILFRLIRGICCLGRFAGTGGLCIGLSRRHLRQRLRGYLGLARCLLVLGAGLHGRGRSGWRR
jgi:hypothetical protein